MDFDKLINTILNGLKVAIPSILVGIIGTYLVYDSVVLVGKNSELETLRVAVDVEKGRQNVLSERIKLLGDKSVFLESQLKYKSPTQKALEEESKQKIEMLTKENIQLHRIKEKLEKAEGSKVDIAELSAKLDKYVAENAQLKAQLGKFTSEVLVSDYQMSEGESWSGLGGRVTFGVSDVTNEYKKGNVALVVSSIFDTEDKKVQAGNSFDFSVEGNNYKLVVNKVAYIGDYVTISVYKKI
ncbi:hypothetical protein [Vibrio sp.]|uniref:hypothetical protein n=1 Tax=Vibrio sp. TaxID=678 RepID=UPI003AA8D4E4